MMEPKSFALRSHRVRAKHLSANPPSRFAIADYWAVFK